jgi:transcriptional regulator with XRE-family HTH domain
VVFLPVNRFPVKPQSGLFPIIPYLFTGQMFSLAYGLPCGHTTAVFHLGDVVRKRRRAQGLTLVALSVSAGVSKTTLSELERKGRNFERLTLTKIASALGVSEADLYDELREQPQTAGVGGPARREDNGQAGAEPDEPDVEEEDAQSMPDADQIHAMTTALRLAPPERRDEFIQHCFSYAMNLRQKSRRRATGTDPNG